MVLNGPAVCCRVSAGGQGADVNGARAPFRGGTALEGAAEHGRLDTVVLLLEEGCNVDDVGREQCIRAVKLARDNEHMEIPSIL